MYYIALRYARGVKVFKYSVEVNNYARIFGASEYIFDRTPKKRWSFLFCEVTPAQVQFAVRPMPCPKLRDLFPEHPCFLLIQ
jgi:hypothetical protein